MSVSEWIEGTNAIGMYVKRLLTKSNYLIQTDAIKNYILPDTNYYNDRSWLKYAEEADILNVIIFKSASKERRELNLTLAINSNIRDYATINELTVLLNLETHNAELIREGKTKEERFQILLEIVSYQLNILNKVDDAKQIKQEKN